ncbi:MAG: MFS transporter [Solobacterium sp.]|nr:MFS transporter [Solobacterium sp.]
MTQERKSTPVSRMAYGAADIYGGGAFVVISTFYTVFLTKAQGMPAAMAGTIPLIGKVWDAVTDPIMGNICDRTRSRFGAKRFYIMTGSLLSALTFILMWITAPLSSTGAKYTFYVLMYMLFSTGFTIVMVPYNGLLPDMVDDYTERSRYSSVRMMFSTFGAILAGLIPTILIKDNTDPKPYLTVALLFGVIFTASILFTFFGTWEKQKEPVRIPLKDSFIQSFTVYKSRAFRMFIAIFLLGQGAADFVTGLAVYYVDDVLNAYGGGNFTILMGVLLVAQFAGTILFGQIMQRTSKTFPILLGFPIRIAATLAMLAFSHEGANFTIILVLSFIVGLGMAASSTSIYAILSDMADVDELITSISRPGTCSGMATFIRKIATGMSSAVIGLLLGMIGYDEIAASSGLRQAASVQSGIAYIYIFVPVILMVLTIVVAMKFPLKQREFEIVKKEIARRKGEETSTITPEEKTVCEKVTGFAYEQLWNSSNALKL